MRLLRAICHRTRHDEKNEGVTYITSTKASNMSCSSYVYIITNQHNRVLYTGVTTNLKIRIWEHITKAYPQSFTAKYNCTKLVWYEVFGNVNRAIDREKQIKGGSRTDKLKLIESFNPQWRNLWEEVKEW